MNKQHTADKDEELNYVMGIVHPFQMEMEITRYSYDNCTKMPNDYRSSDFGHFVILDN